MDIKEIFSQDNSLYEIWRLCNADRSDLPAIEYFGNQWTFKQANEMIDIYARAFMQMLPDKTKSVTFCVPTLPSTIFAFYALNKIGVRANFVSDALLKYDAKEYLEETDTEILILLDAFFPRVAEAIGETALKKIIIISFANDVTTTPDYVSEPIFTYLQKSDSAQKVQISLPHMEVISLDDFIAIGHESTELVKSVYTKGDTAIVLYTGGSTGIPKGIEMTNEAFNRMSGLFASKEVGFDIKCGDRNLCLIPPNHPTSFVHSIVSYWNWGTIQVLQPFYNKNTFAYDLYNLKVQIAVAAPSHFATLPMCTLPDGALSHYRHSCCGGEAVPFELAMSINDALKRLGAQCPYIVNGYGMSELGPATNISFGVPDLLNRSGRPMPGITERIVDDNGNILADNMRGNLEIKTPCRMKGYFKQPGLTKEFFTEDGFGKTGDIAVRDENGYYEILGRATDTVIVPDGTKIYLFDIERVIYKEPAVIECEVVGLDVGGIRVPVAHIVLKTEYVSKENEVILRVHKLCQESLEANEIPHGYKIREAFGTNPISTKRDYKALELERDGYFMVDGEVVREVNF